MYFYRSAVNKKVDQNWRSTKLIRCRLSAFVKTSSYTSHVRNQKPWHSEKIVHFCFKKS